MLEAFSGLGSVVKSNRRSTESWIFYLHYRVTFLVLIFCCILISTQQFIGDKIQCRSRESSAINVELLNAYCWSASTYSVNKAYLKEVGVHVPHPGIEGSENENEYVYRNFYQYVHIVIFFQAILFYVPHILWKSIEPHFLSNITEEINKICIDFKTDSGKDDEKDKKTKLDDEKDKITKLDDEKDKITKLDNEKDKETKLMDSVARFINVRLGSFNSLALKYFFCEILAAANVLVQSYFLDIFLHGKFISLGLWLEAYYNSEILSDPLQLFPLVTICSFRRYGASGYIDVVSSLCILPINAINGKLFLCLWIWFTVLLFLSVCSAVHFVVCMFVPVARIWPQRMSSLLFEQRLENDSYSKLVKEGGFGDWFVLSSLKRNVEQYSFSRLTENIDRKLYIRI